MTWWKTAVAGFLLIASAGITARGFMKQSTPAQEVQIAKARKGPITRTITGAGKLQSATTVKISSNLSGDLIELAVKEGDQVKKGQVLGRIERRRFEAAAKQALAAQSGARADTQLAQVEVTRATREVARVQGLTDQGMASGAELERAQSDRDSAMARLASAKERHTQAAAAFDEASNSLSKTTLLSPIDGTVIELSREVGERVRGSDFSEDVVMTLAALAAMEVKLEVGEHEVLYIRKDQKAEIGVDALEGQTFDGTVLEIAQKALVKNPGTEAEVTSFPITVALNSRPTGVLPGMSAEVRIHAESRSEAIILPVQAVTVRPEKLLSKELPRVEGTPIPARKLDALTKVVFVVDADNRVHLRKVRTGISAGADLEVVEGIQEGDRVVEGPYRTLAKELKEGDAVEEVDPAKMKPREGAGRG